MEGRSLTNREHTGKGGIIFKTATSRLIPGTPKDMGTPPSGKRDPYHSHIFGDSYGRGMGMVWVRGPIIGVNPTAALGDECTWRMVPQDL